MSAMLAAISCRQPRCGTGCACCALLLMASSCGGAGWLPTLKVALAGVRRAQAANAKGRRDFDLQLKLQLAWQLDTLPQRNSQWETSGVKPDTWSVAQLQAIQWDAEQLESCAALADFAAAATDASTVCEPGDNTCNSMAERAALCAWERSERTRALQDLLGTEKGR